MGHKKEMVSLIRSHAKIIIGNLLEYIFSSISVHLLIISNEGQIIMGVYLTASLREKCISGCGQNNTSLITRSYNNKNSYLE